VAHIEKIWLGRINEIKDDIDEDKRNVYHRKIFLIY